MTCGEGWSGEPIDSAVIESNSVAAEVSLRILGLSENYVRPNDLLWVVTMNTTRASPDLVSRALPVRLAYEGNPADRVFDGQNPVDYARTYRPQILGELASLVDHWNAQGRPDSGHRHRCDRWAQVVGGVMATAGFPEFLGNVGEATVAFNTDVDDLAALAEAAWAAGPPYVSSQTPAAEGREGLPASGGQRGTAADWWSLFQRANVRQDELQSAKGDRAKATKIGQ